MRNKEQRQILISSDSAPVFVCYTREKRALQQVCYYKVETSRDELYLPSSWRKMKSGQRLMKQLQMETYRKNIQGCLIERDFVIFVHYGNDYIS